MERTWRWFGKKDKITLAQLKQIGVPCTTYLLVRYGRAKRFATCESILNRTVCAGAW